mgnify:CR=1 FL=1
MSLYDINGNIVTNNISDEDIKKALISAIASGEVNLGNSVGATLSLNSLDANWQTNAETVYNNLLTEYKKIPNDGIPIFITTDQHGRGIEGNRFINNIDTDGMEITNINLGDTVTDVASLCHPAGLRCLRRQPLSGPRDHRPAHRRGPAGQGLLCRRTGLQQRHPQRHREDRLQDGHLHHPELPEQPDL